MGTARLERGAMALAIPFQGHAPTVKVQKLRARQYVVDLAGAQLATEEVQSQAVGGKHLLAGWSLDELPSGQTVRLRLTLNQDVDPDVHVEQLGHQLRLSLGSAPRFQLAHRNLPPQVAFAKPLPLPAKPVAKAPVALTLPAGVAMVPPVHHGPVVLGAPHFDAARHCLVVPVNGTVDPSKLSLVHLGARWAYLDLPGSHPAFGGMKYEDKAHHGLQRWVMAKRPHTETTRLSFNLAAGTQLGVKLAGKELLVAVKPMAPVVAHRPAKPAPVAVAAKPHKPHRPVAVAAKPIRPVTSRPYFDQARRALVLPYTGETPLYRFNDQDEAAASLEIKGDVAAVGRLEQRFASHPLMQSWQLARNPRAGTVTVNMNFRRPTELVVAVDPAHHQLLLLPQARLAGDGAAVAAQPEATLAGARLPAEGRQILLPYTGRVPSYCVEQVSPTQAVVDFEGAQLEGNAVQFAEPAYHPTVSHWLLTNRPAQHLVRLALNLRQPGGVAVYQDQTNQRLVLELTGDEPQVGARTRSQQPREWPGEQRLVGKKAS